MKLNFCRFICVMNDGPVIKWKVFLHLTDKSGIARHNEGLCKHVAVQKWALL